MNFALYEDSKGHQTSEKKKNAYSARICLREWHQGFNSDSKPLECSHALIRWPILTCP